MTVDLSNVELNKDAYLLLSNGNYATLNEATDEFIAILSEDEGDEFDIEAAKGVLMATMNFLRTQRKLDKFLQNNVPEAPRDVVAYALEVAEQIGLKENVSVSINVTPKEELYRDLLNILYPTK